MSIFRFSMYVTSINTTYKTNVSNFQSYLAKIHWVKYNYESENITMHLSLSIFQVFGNYSERKYKFISQLNFVSRFLWITIVFSLVMISIQFKYWYWTLLIFLLSLIASLLIPIKGIPVCVIRYIIHQRISRETKCPAASADDALVCQLLWMHGSPVEDFAGRRYYFHRGNGLIKRPTVPRDSE